MNKFILTLLFLLFSSFAFGQESPPCSQNLLAAQIRGFSIGMSKDAVNKAIPNIEWLNERYGVENSRSIKMTDKLRFENVRQIDFEVFENKIYSIEINYAESSFQWSGKELAEAVSKSWNITEKWREESYGLFINCQERQVFVQSDRLRLTDTTVLPKIKEKEKTDRENRRKNFKP